MLKTLALKQETTLFILLLSVFYVLLARLSGEEEWVVGTVTAGRSHAHQQQMIGIFVNMLPLRNFPKSTKFFKQFLAEVSQRTVEAFENQDYPFDELVSTLAPRQDTGRNPLFDVSFGLENQFEPQGYLTETAFAGKTRPYSFKVNHAKFDLTLMGAESSEGLLFNLEYNCSLFTADTIGRLAGYYKQLLCSACAGVHETLGDMAMIPLYEREQILFRFNYTCRPFPLDQTIHGLFAVQVKRGPQRIAVHFQGDEPVSTAVTYEELNNKAGRLAGLLRQKGIGPNDIVSLVACPSVEMIIAIMGILKAGGGYLPIDPQYPAERFQYMITDSNAKLMVSAGLNDCLFQGISRVGEVIRVENLLWDAGVQLDRPAIAPGYGDGTERTPDNGVTTGAGPRDLAYVIYTSGTTGKPKGVAVEHRGVVNTLVCRRAVYRLNARTIALQLFSFSFDGFVASFFTPVVSGARKSTTSKYWKHYPRNCLACLTNQTASSSSKAASMYVAPAPNRNGIRCAMPGTAKMRSPDYTTP